MGQIAATAALSALMLQSVMTEPVAVPTSAAQTEAVQPAAAVQPTAIILPKDTPIHLMTLTEVTTKTDTVGDKFKLRVDKDVQINGATIIPVGTLAWGEVTSAKSSGNVGKAGSLTAQLLYVELNGQQIPISGDTSSKGRTGTAEAVVGVLSLGILGLFAKGNNAKIKAGEKITAFVTNDTELKPAMP
jgi:hypothetical protein